MIFGRTKGKILYNVISHILIWANQKTESFVFSFTHFAMFDITCFPGFVGASNFILSVLSCHVCVSREKLHLEADQQQQQADIRLAQVEVASLVKVVMSYTGTVI